MARWSYLGLVMASSLCVLAPNAKAASIADCGNVDVQADATCNVEGGVTCTGQCQLPDTCSVKLYGGCKGNCVATLPSCEASCTGNCDASCTGSANYDCTGTCNVSCSGNCSASCQSKCQSNNTGASCQADCEATCKATCQGECNTSCSGSASGSCQANCQASCKGSCNGQARLDCQLQCSPPAAYVDCAAQCNATCNADGGLFCSGHYVDYNNNLQKCVDAIKAALPTVTVNVNYHATASGSCDGGTCSGQAHADASASCALSRVGEKKGLSGGILALVAAGLAIGVRRRQRK